MRLVMYSHGSKFYIKTLYGYVRKMQGFKNLINFRSFKRHKCIYPPQLLIPYIPQVHQCYSQLYSFLLIFLHSSREDQTLQQLCRSIHSKFILIIISIIPILFCAVPLIHFSICLIRLLIANFVNLANKS